MSRLRDLLERHHRIHAAVTLVVLVAAVAVVSQDRSTPVTVDGALESFRTGNHPSVTSPARPTATATPEPSSAATPHPTTTSDPAATDPPASASDRGPTPTAEPSQTVPAPTSDTTADSDGAGTPTPTPPATAPPSRPAEGVYVYVTDGHDEIDAFGGRRHDYPPETTVTVRHTDCGTHTRWDALAERWDEATTCLDHDGDRQVQAIVSYREFLGHGQRDDLDCEIPLPADPPPGARWTGACTGEDTDVTLQLTAVGRETIPVEGTSVETVHIRIDASFSGRTEGRQTSDRWYTPDTGLDVRTHTTTDVQSDGPTGPVHYRERVQRQISSLQPRR